jgi:dihydrofolate synthase/folylpolyglutamate synthase
VTVLESLRHLRLLGWNLPAGKVQEGLAHVKKLTGLHGRWEMIGQHPTGDTRCWS